MDASALDNNLKTILWILATAALAQGFGMVLPSYFGTILMLAGINAILAASLNVVNGLSGQFSLGHAGFMAVGAYTGASVSVFLLPSWQGTFVLEQFALLAALVAAAIAGAVIGLLVGLPSLRLKGDYLAIVTLGFGEIIRVVFLNIPAVGGARGMIGIPKTSSFFAVTLVLTLVVVAIHRLVHSTHGRALLAVREDEVAAESMGVDTTRYKMNAFVFAAAAAAMAGALFAHDQQYINPSSFGFMKSVELVIMVVLGGLGSISGSVVAAFLLTILPEALRPLQQWTGVDLRMVIYSLALILLMLVRPQGLFGRKELWQLKWTKH
jgi:branched-chain amino acid transport system permease protein